VAAAEFFERMLRAGASTAYDAIGVHPSGWSWGLGDAGLHTALDDIRRLRDRLGRRGAALWVTELGLSTTGPPGPRDLHRFDDAEQARSLVHQYRLLSAMPDIAAVIVHTLVEPHWPGERERELGFGIVRRDGLVPKQAYCALAQEMRSGFECPGGVGVPRADGQLDERWRAQSLLHDALSAARAYHRAESTFAGLDARALRRAAPRISLRPAHIDDEPSSSADPARIAILRPPGGRRGSVVLCNASRAGRAYCVWEVPGRFTAYGTDSESIAAAGRVAVSRANGW
jgi:hypothetical protein